jgi:hypothetical protein
MLKSHLQILIVFISKSPNLNRFNSVGNITYWAFRLPITFSHFSGFETDG